MPLNPESMVASCAVSADTQPLWPSPSSFREQNRQCSLQGKATSLPLITPDSSSALITPLRVSPKPMHLLLQ